MQQKTQRPMQFQITEHACTSQYLPLSHYGSERRQWIDCCPIRDDQRRTTAVFGGRAAAGHFRPFDGSRRNVGNLAERFALAALSETTYEGFRLCGVASRGSSFRRSSR